MLRKLYWFLFIYDLNGPRTEQTSAMPQSFKKKLMHDATCLVLFSYTLLVFNPVMPFIADKIAHTFWEKEHLLTIHQENGKYHVHLELVNAAKQETKDKSGSFKFSADDYLHVLTVVDFNFTSSLFAEHSYQSYVCKFPLSYPDSDYKPPRV